MHFNKNVVLLLVVLASVAVNVEADCYGLSPRWHNNRFNEITENVQEQQRCMDTENNAQGGRGWGPPPDYIAGSVLMVQVWAQHGLLGGPNESQLVLQALCSDTQTNLFDGDPSAGENGRQPPVLNEGDLTGDNQVRVRHEPSDYALACERRERNRGLYTGSVNPSNNRGAMATRQNPNGQLHGRECTEERDYYPYWHPTPWFDISIHTTNVSQCPEFQANSGNVRNYGLCSIPDYNNRADCEDNEGTWTEGGRKTGQEPSCFLAPRSRENYNGNSQTSDHGSYPFFQNVTLAGIFEPQAGQSEKKCILRMRYNVTCDDDKGDKTAFWDYRHNDNTKYAQDNPTAVISETDGVMYPALTLALNRQNFPSRCFQDRTQLMNIIAANAGSNQCSEIQIWQTTGRRGGYAAAHPNHEHQTAWVEGEIPPGACIDYALAGTEYNQNGAAGQGGATNSKSNVCQHQNNDPHTNYPAHVADSTMFEESELGQADYGPTVIGACLVGSDGGETESGPLLYQTGVIRVSRTGKRYAMSTVNNDQTNRGDKHTVDVQVRWSIALIILLILGGLMLLAGLGFLASYQFARKNPDSKVASWFHEHNMARPAHMRR